MSAPSALGPGAEFDLIRTVWRRLGERAGGLGDDCAVIDVGGVALAFSCDLSVEDEHFRLGWLEPEEIGWRACTAALSDLAAMAAEPVGVLASVGVSPEQPDEFLAGLMDGLTQCAASVGAKLLKGDLTKSDRVIVDVAVVGKAPAPAWRKGAVAGQGIWVTGTLGAPASAVRAWERRVEPDHETRARFAHPVPRIAEAAWLKEHGAAAMIDVSDGLTGDAGHLAAASGVSIALDADRVPVHPAADGIDDALSGGDEYELLVALPAAFNGAAGFESAFGLPLTRVGTVEAGAGVALTKGGTPMEPPRSFSHF